MLQMAATKEPGAGSEVNDQILLRNKKIFFRYYLIVVVLSLVEIASVIKFTIQELTLSLYLFSFLVLLVRSSGLEVFYRESCPEICNKIYSKTPVKLC